MNLPLMCRGLSPEGRKIRDRHQGTLTIGVQGITVHPAERGRSQNNFIQNNVRRLHEIQVRCRDRENNRRSQPLKATRDSSASTSSSLKQANVVPNTRNGPKKFSRRSQSVEREGSAHSDYFSLTEEQLEPLASQLNHQYYAQHNGPTTSSDHNVFSNNESAAERLSRPGSPNPYFQPPLQANSHFSSSPEHRTRSGSPVVLRPLTSKFTQTLTAPGVPALGHIPGSNRNLVSDYGLTQEMRKMRMDTLISKIKNQKPSCELDYNMHYKAIESQHKMLLDNSDRLSLYGSSDGSAHYDGETHRSAAKSRALVTSGPRNSKMVRARSFDRDVLNSKGVNTGLKPDKANTNTKNKSKKGSVHPSSPQLNRRFSKSSHNLAQTGSVLSAENTNQGLPASASEKEKRCHRNSKLNNSAHSPQKGGLPYSHPVQRSRSNIAGPPVVASIENSHETPPSSSNRTPHDLFCDVKSNCDELAGVMVPLNRTASGGNLNLNATMSSSCDIDFNDQDHSDGHESGSEEELHLNLLSETQCPVVNQPEDPGVLSEGILTRTCGTPGGEIQATAERSKDSDEDEDMMRTSTPVPDVLRNVSSASPLSPKHDKPLANPSPGLLKKREQHQTEVSDKPALRRSQSLKNVRQRHGEPPPTYKRGKIPRYILARKEEERRLAELALAVDPDCPPGHSPLPDHERRNTLHLLRKSQADVMRELSSLPVAQDTLRVKKLRHDLEEKLTQIEDGLRIFSQPKVYIMNDE